MKLMKNSTTKLYAGFEPCFDISGIQHDHGEYYTPQQSACTRCVCDNGKAQHCVALQCQKPTCKNYEQVPGKCCEYTCPREFVLTDKSTVAVVVSLSIILIVILVAITMIWRRMRRKEKYGKRLETASMSSSQQETDLDSLIRKHSILNNMRHSTQSNGHLHEQNSLSASPLLSEHETTITSNSTNDKLLNNCINSTSSSSTTVACTTSMNQVGHQATNVALPKNELILTEKGASVSTATTMTTNCCSHTKNNNDSTNSPQHEACYSSSQNKCCTHQMRRFEPPPPYSPPNAKAAFV